MKITIDTKEDSHEEIRKIIKMLSSLMGEEAFTNQGNIFEDKEPGPSQNVFSMFEDKSQNAPESQEEQIKPEEKKKEVSDMDIPGLEEYY